MADLEQQPELKQEEAEQGEKKSTYKWIYPAGLWYRVRILTSNPIFTVYYVILKNSSLTRTLQTTCCVTLSNISLHHQIHSN